jgi:protein-tyrosine phosphatase
MSKPTRILFVCLGNIVRSPLAENLFRHLAAESQPDGVYEVDSAGTSAWHVGERPDPRMRRVAEERGLRYTGQARQVHPEDLRSFDLILAMDRENQADLLAMARSPEERAKVRLLRDYDPQAGVDASVPDPYYGGPDGFAHTYEIVARAVRGLIQSLETEGL